MVFTAPGKINLYLKVIQSRDDGYHEIETLFEKISIFDEISIDFSGNTTFIVCDDPRVPTDKNSLLGRAARMFSEKSGKDDKFSISVKKIIPVSAGLGGGSSDAAALLKGLNEMTEYPLDKETLLDIARELGADIPFFMEKYSFAYGTGRGDIIKNADMDLNISHILINPSFEVSTRDIYGKTAAFGLTNSNGIDTMVSTFSGINNIKRLAENLHNDLQTIVLHDFPVVEEILSILKKTGAEGVLLSGSGPSGFGIFSRDKIEHAREALERDLSDKNAWRIYVADTYIE